jgi:transposase-like protein
MAWRGHCGSCPQRGIVDTSDQMVSVGVDGGKKRRRSVEERGKIVEETLQPAASVSRVARRHDVNANQVFYWRKLYREGRLGSIGATKLLPVKVAEERTLGSEGRRTRSAMGNNGDPAGERNGSHRWGSGCSGTAGCD